MHAVVYQAECGVIAAVFHTWVTESHVNLGLLVNEYNIN